MKARTKTLYDKARRGLAEGDAGYWKAAEAMAALADDGETQRAIGRELDCSESTVRNYLKVWGAYCSTHPRPSFSEAMIAVRGAQQQPHIPRTPERRAALAAELLKDKTVYEQPVVRKAVDRHVDRELRQAAAAFNREHKIPTRTERNREQRRLSVVVNRMFWRDLLFELGKLNRMLGEANGEFERTGLPEGQAGDIIRAVRNLSKAADRFATTATARAVGKPMNRGA